MRIRCAAFVLAFVCCSAAVAHGQDRTPLQLRWPTAIGAAGTGHDADSYLYRAWTGITWISPIVAGGGTSKEYVYTLNNGPAGMTLVDPGVCTVRPCAMPRLEWVKPT